VRTTALRTLLTGGGSGIGLAVARRLAPDNTVVIAGRDEGRLARAVSDVPMLRAQALDVTSEEDTRRAIDRVTDELGGLDLVIHAAGVMHAFGISDPTAAELTAREIDTNLLGSERVARLTLPILRRSDAAALVLISSVVALVPAPVSRSTRRPRPQWDGRRCDTRHSTEAREAPRCPACRPTPNPRSPRGCPTFEWQQECNASEPG